MPQDSKEMCMARLDGSERKAKGNESRKGIFDQTTSPALSARIRSCIFPVNKEG